MTEEEQAAAIVTAVAEATAGLKAKNAELLGKVKQLQKGQEIDPQTVIDLENKIDKLQTDLIASQKLSKDSTKNLELTQKQLQDVTDRSNRATIDTELTNALIGAGVKEDHYLTAVKALFSSQAKIGEDGKSLIGDKALGDAIKEWGATDAAKHFQSAPGNAGGGSHGNQGGTPGGQKTQTRAAFGAATPAAQMEFIKSGGVVTD